MTNVEKEEFLERNELGLVDDIEMADFIERHLIDASEQKEFKKRKITIAGCFTGKYDCTLSNERFMQKTFKRWNQILGKKVFSED